MASRIFSKKRRGRTRFSLDSVSTTNEESPWRDTRKTETSRTSTAVPSVASVPDDSGVPDVSTRDIFSGDEAAMAVNNHEKSMTFRYALRNYRAGMMWAVLLAAPMIMEGYAASLPPSFFSYEAFKTSLGQREPGKTEPTIPNLWQSGIIMAAACGQLAGLWVAPRMSKTLGYGTCGLLSALFISPSLIVGIWALHTGNPLAVFLVSQVLLGMPRGLLQATILPYVFDMTPLRLRAAATTMVHVFWLTGRLFLAIVLRCVSNMSDNNWRIQVPLLVQSIWPMLLPVLAAVGPKSPVVLARRGEDQDAKKTLRRFNRDPQYDADAALAVLRAVDAREKPGAQQMGFMECFRGTNLRRTEIAVMAYVTQQFIGIPLMAYPVQRLRWDGLTDDDALWVTAGIHVICILVSLWSMVGAHLLSRRTLWLGGLACQVGCLAAIGLLAAHTREGPDDVSWIIVGIIMMMGIIYHFTIGSMCHVIVAETPATRLKTATNAIARSAHILVGIANLFLVPRLLEGKPHGWGLGLRVSLVWAGTAAACLAWGWVRLPEMKDRTPAEVDLLFERKVGARDWRGLEVWTDYELT